MQILILSIASLVNDVAFHGVGPDTGDEAFNAFVLAVDDGVAQQNQSTDYTDAIKNLRNLWMNAHEDC